MDAWSTLDPLDYYKQELEPTHRRNVAEAFNALLKQSGVDPKVNRAGVRKLKQLEAAVKEAEGVLSRLAAFGTVLNIVMTLCGLALAAHAALLLLDCGPLFSGEICFWTAVAGVGAALLRFCWVRGALRSAVARQAELVVAKEKQHELLLRQVAPLNALITWDTVDSLLGKSLPAYTPAPYVTEAALRELRDRYGWNGEPLRSASVTAVRSGRIAGNPFFFVRAKEVRMVPKKYGGSRTIHWTERKTDSDGRTRTVYRSQTLYASVEHAAPEFFEFSFVLYAHDAAPELVFSRSPSKYSGETGSIFHRWGKRRETKRLEAFSRNLDDEYGFTMMANREFETLFHSTDRSDEAAFRLLFTPLAQQQMVRLLNDTDVGYGDDFSFVKDKKINILLPEHLKAARLSSDPAPYRGYDIDVMRRQFFDGITAELRHLWFGLAPLLCVPLYREQRSLSADCDGCVQPSGDWEHELQANLMDLRAFRPQHCITDCILKSQTVAHSGSSSEAHIKAVGFTGCKRTDHVSVLASNGRSYDVPVPWTEYITVRKTTSVRFTSTPSAAYPRHVCADVGRR